MNAAIYLRVSTDEQDTEIQLPELEQVCRARGWAFEVRRETASGAKERPVLDELCAEVRRGRVHAVVVWALDRLGRNFWETLDRVRDFDACRCQLVSAREPWLDLQGPTRGLLLVIFAWVAEQERTRLRERTRAGLARARQQGTKLGRPKVKLPDDYPAIVARWRAENGGKNFRTLASMLKIKNPGTAFRVAKSIPTQQPSAA